MKYWHKAHLCELQAMSDEDEILAAAYRSAHTLGFDYLGFATTPDFNGSSSHMEGVSNMPAAWCERYRQQGYVNSDPTVRHCLQSVVPLLWSDQLFACAPALHSEAWEHGMQHGVSLAIHDTGGRMSMVSLIRRDLPVTADEFCLKAGDCLLLSNLLHEHLGGHLFKSLDGSPAHLSTRELEMLRWSAQGKTAGDIGMILSLSERTVNFHINNAVRKLGSSNKITAVVHAAQAGML